MGRSAVTSEERCLPGHTSYASAMLATNAVTLHVTAFLHCEGFHAWPCGDHYHVGHRTPATGRRCKQHPVHVATGARLRRHRPAWLP